MKAAWLWIMALKYILEQCHSRHAARKTVGGCKTPWMSAKQCGKIQRPRMQCTLVDPGTFSLPVFVVQDLNLDHKRFLLFVSSIERGKYDVGQPNAKL